MTVPQRSSHSVLCCVLTAEAIVSIGPKGLAVAKDWTLLVVGTKDLAKAKEWPFSFGRTRGWSTGYPQRSNSSLVARGRSIEDPYRSTSSQNTRGRSMGDPHRSNSFRKQEAGHEKIRIAATRTLSCMPTRIRRVEGRSGRRGHIAATSHLKAFWNAHRGNMKLSLHSGKL